MIRKVNGQGTQLTARVILKQLSLYFELTLIKLVAVLVRKARALLHKWGERIDSGLITSIVFRLGSSAAFLTRSSDSSQGI